MTGMIKTLSMVDSVQWDSYVKQHPKGTFYHLSGWKEAIEFALDHRCYYLYVTQDEQIKAVLPLVLLDSVLFGRSLVSTPFCIHGGVLADEECYQAQLIEFTKTLANELNVEFVEFRIADSMDSERFGLATPAQESHALFGCEIANSDEAILASIKKKQRAVIRQSMKSNLSYKIEDNIDNLFDIYSQSVRNLGSPVFSKKFLQRLFENFSKQCDVLTVYSGARPVSSVMSFYYHGQVIPHYGGGTVAARDLKSNDFMYYQLMCHARHKGCHYFDFGRSKVDSGAYKYKKHWGMKPTPMVYQFYLNNGGALPQRNPNNPKYALVINLWKRLPLKASQVFGPMLSKYLG
ncbi:FemAB family XrtA/PEP-CTERM system-associated protein [Psychrobium sp. 1_MG-2023]|uniref:FemAB family XrtA/PEP-CTERM system-associated protein n=1 Tax=Psychrobium sp. 1_MG-2023 TaxID=3062624 RepID=UPI000C33925D|nr:FemAB family XrtA/PEP-CTERM system-associated protein [Psychrobium sp. 1_MG-2023]MDP2561126.1 FemAB family PEP-CTERM system-associated protein [Psychrobium sp. 1_MG-2023]PKF55102.1 peptidoglycan bridge formation protein FemAB [Alteromonadales bacterium alter-6D02]